MFSYILSSNPTGWTNIISNSKDIVSCMFYIATGIIALLTYLSARKTVLQPIKTEIFKKQLEQFSCIMKLFNGKNEIELRNLFDFNQVLYCNIIKMLDDYASIFFDVKFDQENRPYNPHNCPSRIVTKEYAEKFFTLADDTSFSVHKNSSFPVDKNSKITFWEEYQYGDIVLTKEYVNATQQIDVIISSPLLPKECIEYLVEIKETAKKNILQIGNSLTTIEKEIPIKYPTLDALKKASIIWIENRCNDNFINLEDSSLKLTDYLRKYLGTDHLLLK